MSGGIPDSGAIRVIVRAGLRRIGWHTLRHTFASHPVMRRARLTAVRELLGHSTIEMTMRYSHRSPDVRKDAVRLVDADPPDNGVDFEPNYVKILWRRRESNHHRRFV